ncbi:VOC family protein [Desulfosporosinus sp. PR]|uniref:VOC family protein n=1 Tax=Candidatus Desulfosporosinus nitrosoreducens TaxID=3401928 RepID=UPI0027FD7C83|nr:VOC family protein [Desulfosporosinus sp. PR]MDQ7096714.1 VOC family protein [Desulfosporosinus sp. PR]
MRLTHSCIITNEVKKLSEFYEKVLQIKAETSGDEYAEFPTDCGILSIFSFSLQESLAKGSSLPGSNRNLILEFNVANVDDEYMRLEKLGVEFVKPLTTQPWGNRSFYFQDPDGNMLNFYTKVK